MIYLSFNGTLCYIVNILIIKRAIAVYLFQFHLNVKLKCIVMTIIKYNITE